MPFYPELSRFAQNLREMELADVIIASPISREELMLALLLQHAAFVSTNTVKANADWPMPLYIIQAHAVFTKPELATALIEAMPKMKEC